MMKRLCVCVLISALLSVAVCTSLWGQVLQDFEAGNGGYAVSIAGGAASSWAYGTPTSGPNAAHSGSKVWATNPAGNYSNNEDSSLISPAIDLGAYAGRNIVLRWYQYVNTLNGDWVYVDASYDDGANWGQVYSGGGSSPETVWTRHAVVLSPAYATSQFRVRFHFTSDANGVNPGWYIDDVRLAPEPTVTIVQAAGQVDPTVGSPINFAAVFSEPVNGFVSADVGFSGAGAKVATVTNPSSDKKTFNVAITGMTDSGTVTAWIGANAATDEDSGLQTVASTSTDDQVTYDITRPTVGIGKAAGQASPATSSPILFTATFDEPVVDFDKSNVTVEGTSGATQADSVTDLGDGKSFTISVGGMTAGGTVKVSISANKAHDAAGNGNTASSDWGNEVTFDSAAPTVTVLPDVNQANPTNSPTVYFVAAFSEPVSDFDKYDVVIGGTAAPTDVMVSAWDGRSYSLAVTGMTKQGTVTASIRDSAAYDSAENYSSASTNADNWVIYDTIRPTVTVSQAAAQVDPTNALPISFTVVFSEPVAGFVASSLSWNGEWWGISNVTVTDSGDHMSYGVLANGPYGDGDFQLGVNAGAVQDLAGNNCLASTNLDNKVTYDSTAPSVTVEQAVGQGDLTNASPVKFTATFSEALPGFDGTKVTLGGTAGATTAIVKSSGDPKVFTIEVSGMAGSGTVTASISKDAVHDAAGNGNSASTSGDNSVTYDVDGLTVTVERAATQSDPSGSSSIYFVARFNKVVQDFDESDVVIGGTAGPTSVVVNVHYDPMTYSPDYSRYDIAVSGMTGPGTVTMSVPAGGAHDAMGNANIASNSIMVTYDNVAPTVTINQSANQMDPTNTLPINFTVVFSKPVMDFTAQGVSLSYWYGPSPTTVVTDSGDHMTYTVAVSGVQSSTCTASIGSGVAHDIGGNGNAGSTSTDNQVIYTTTRPTANVSAPTGDVSTPVNFTINFSEDVSSINVSKVTITGGVAGTPFKNAPDMFGQSLSWTLPVIPTRTDVSCMLKDDAAYSTAGNGSTASNTATATIAPPGGTWSGLRMVSLPIVPDEEDPQEALGFSKNWWTIWDPDSGQYLQYPQAATMFVPREETPGRGFWTQFGSVAPAPKGGIPAQNTEAVIHLKPGWNLIGQPFLKDVTWDRNVIMVQVGGIRKTLKQAKSLVSNFAWGWSGWSYYMVADKSLYPDAIGTLAPWQAYWLVSVEECDLILPAQ